MWSIARILINFWQLWPILIKYNCDMCDNFENHEQLWQLWSIVKIINNCEFLWQLSTIVNFCHNYQQLWQYWPYCLSRIESDILSVMFNILFCTTLLGYTNHSQTSVFFTQKVNVTDKMSDSIRERQYGQYCHNCW